MQKKSVPLKSKLENLEEKIAQQLQRDLKVLSFDIPSERVYIPRAEMFHQILQERKIQQIKNGGGYHFVLPIRNNKKMTYWKVTLTPAESRVFEHSYSQYYTIRKRRTLPGVFY